FSRVVGLRAGVRVLDALAWTRAERAPVAAERARTLLVPWRFVVLSALLWLGGNLVFTVGNVLSDNPGSQVVSSAVGTAMGGATTSLVCYLLVERVLRPVFAEA